MIRAQFVPALLFSALFAVGTGVLFPIAVWLAAQTFFPYQANGSLMEKRGETIGSELIGQQFTDPRYFHPRPSAAGSGYDAMSSGGTNLGPTSRKLFEGLPDDPATSTNEIFLGVADLAKAYREENELPSSVQPPVDAVTRSASGLDPHISPRNAQLQAARVAKARQRSPQEILALVESNTEGRFLTLFGERRVNVLKLNLALDKMGE
ncbi:MAG: K(+)-transporting ATPase subunit C [Deltaproteobacteria bacterium]|nr:K(+)-transporting ATPase subunit C [Deltaproteobacteria bacterium]